MEHHQQVLSQTDKVLYEVDDNIARLTINRPERMNAMDTETYQALSEAWIDVRDNPDVWVAIVTGSGRKAFSSGADLGDAVDPGSRSWHSFWQTQQDMILNRGLEVWKPVIAAVNGYCLGGGVTLLLATDIRIAGSDASFGLSEVKRGIVAGNGGTQRIARQLPHPLAMELLLTAEMMDAETFAEWGLLNSVVEPDAVLETAEEYAERIVANAPLAIQASKELAVRGQEMSLPDALRLEASFQRHLLQTDDANEGVAAFREKREPEWRAE